MSMFQVHSDIHIFGITAYLIALFRNPSTTEFTIINDSTLRLIWAPHVHIHDPAVKYVKKSWYSLPPPHVSHNNTLQRATPAQGTLTGIQILNIKYNYVRFQVLTAASMMFRCSLMMEAVRTSETSVDYHFTRQYIPEDNSEQNKTIKIFRPCDLNSNLLGPV
jgi:hypothetical protein